MRWVLNIASNYLRVIVGIAVMFFLIPFQVSHLGLDLFGLWSLIFAVVGLFGLLDLGFATAAMKYVAELTASGDHAARNQVLSTLLVVYTVLGLICIALVAILAGPASGWFALKPDQAAPFTLALWLLGGVVAINFPASLIKAILIGSGRMHLVNGIELVTTLVNAALIVILLQAGLGLVGMAIATATTMLLGPVVMLPLTIRLTPGLSVSPRLFAPARVRELLGFSVYFFIANVAVLIILRMDPVVIKTFLPLTAVAVYAVGAKIAEYTYLLNKQFSNALMPLVSLSKGAGDTDTVRRILVDGTRFLLAIAVPFVALLLFYSEPFIVHWMGPDFAESVTVLRILLLAMLLASVQLNAANVLGMTGQHRFVAFAMGGSALLNLALSLILIQFFGLLGVALGTLIATFLVEFTLVVPRACRDQGLALTGFVRRAIWPTLPALVPTLGTAWLLAQWHPISGFVWIFLEGAASALVYFTVFYWSGLTAAERDLIAGKLRRRFKSRPA
ncbi:MATE family efflux transporter [uncultured Thiodictyon sp.]|uniref:MATE family efflux transporter n=1 Tax=uncultured Thiodictyon sp. TaxID=1846217 RepID=UPI0025F1A0F3|nr:MATE family efflux transporter [uncultured Thiodictyon sp.]